MIGKLERFYETANPSGTVWDYVVNKNVLLFL